MTYPHIETLDDYAQFQADHANGVDELRFLSSGACPDCEECGFEDVDAVDCEEYELAGEPHFSYYPCDTCARPLGGDRYPAHGITNDDKTIHLNICTDCLFYVVYGRLDDVTMLEIEKEVL